MKAILEFELPAERLDFQASLDGQCLARVMPLTLTWSPEDGFGASARMGFGRLSPQR